MTPLSGRRVLLGFSLVLVAFNLRPLFSSLSAVLPDAMATTGITAAGAGVLTTLPVICLGAFAPLAPGLARRFGPERTILALLVLLALGTGLRGAPGYGALLVGSVLAGAAIAVGNVLLPGLVKRDFADRTSLLTGLYVMGICGGGALGAGLTVPLAREAGLGWAGALAAWAVPVAATALIWAAVTARGSTASAREGRPVVGLWRDPLAWRITVLMGLQSALAYAVFGWLAPILRERGFDAATAGYVVSLSFLVQLVSSLVTPWFATRGRDQRTTIWALLACAVAGFLGALFAPEAAVPAFAALLGAGQGGLLAATMIVIILRSPDPQVAAQLSGMAQGVGYLLAATGPLLVGLVRAATGGFVWTGALFAALGLGAAWAAASAGRTGHVLARSCPDDRPAGPP